MKTTKTLNRQRASLLQKISTIINTIDQAIEKWAHHFIKQIIESKSDDTDEIYNKAKE